MVLMLLVATVLAAPTMAIADLVNNTGDPTYDPAGPGVSAMLVTKFAKTQAVTMVERKQLQAVLGELQLSASGVVDPATAIQAGRLLGADYMVFGSIFSVKLPTLVISLRVVDTSSGEVVLADEVHGDIGADGEAFYLMLDKLAGRIVEGLDVELSDVDRIELAQVDIRELEALLKYGKRLSRPPSESAKALWRDKSRDMMPAPTRNYWVVYSNEGVQYPASAFARTVGDAAVLAEIAAAREEIDTRGRRRSLAGLGLAGLGALLMAESVMGPELDYGVLIGGGAISGAGLLWSSGATLRRVGQLQGLESPGRYWSPEQADALIDAYNRNLE